MYSRSQSGRADRIRLPEHYSGVAFDRKHPGAPSLPHERTYCADGLPVPLPPPMDELTVPKPSDGPDEKKSPPPPEKSVSEGLLGAIGAEELLLLGIIFLLSQKQGEDDTILLLLLLLLRR